MLVYKFTFNGEDITNLVSVGAIAREILSEPLDIGSFHLPFDIKDIEYEMKGLLQIIIEDIDFNGNTLKKKQYDFIVIDDEVNLGDRIDYWKHDLQLIEYTAKLDDYDVKSLAYTKRLRYNRPAPFEYVLDWAEDSIIPILAQRRFIIRQVIYLDKVSFNRIYFTDETIRVGQVDRPVFAKNIAGSGSGQWGRPELAHAIFRVKDKDGTIVYSERNISQNRWSFSLPEGEYEFEYGFKRDTSNISHFEDYYPIYEEDGMTVKFHIAYRFKVKIMEREDISIYCLLERVNAMVSKFGGVESKHYFNKTRIFNIDPEIAEYLKQIEAPQTYIQHATLRQTLNTIFSYVNAISRLKFNDNLDILTMDEFDKITGEFELKNISSKSVRRSGSELSIKATSFLERTMPTSLEEPTIISPSADFYKTVRATNIVETESEFEFKLEKPIYKPIKFTTLLRNARIYYYIMADEIEYEEIELGDLEIDLTNRLITKEEWAMKDLATNFLRPYMAKPFSLNVGMAKWNTENLYWQEGERFIRLSEVFGYVFKETLINTVISSAIAEYLALNMVKPKYITDPAPPQEDEVVCIHYEFEYDYQNEPLLFNLEYISLEDIAVDSERKDVYDNFSKYSTSKLNQKDKLVNMMAQTRGMSGDLQRTGQREFVIKEFHDNLSEVLITGMYNKENRLTITDVSLIMQNEYLEAIYSISKDFNRKAMFRGLQQEYRWSEIPTSKQVYERNELYKDYLIITKPDDPKNIHSEITKIEPYTQEIIFENLFNKIYEEGTKITNVFVRTDGFLKTLPQENANEKYVITTPATSFGIKDGLSFSFGFDNNIVAGDAIQFNYDNDEGKLIAYNKAVRYTDEDGTFDKLWFSFKQRNDIPDNLSYNSVFDYPLLMTDTVERTKGLFTTGHPDFSHQDSDYIILHKDSSQMLKMTYQLSILPDDPTLYVFGMMFFSKNYLVSNFEERNMYLYTYDDDKYEYGIFDDLRIKGFDDVIKGYEPSPVRLFDYNTEITYDDVKSILKFRFLGQALTNATKGTTKVWAIGDGEGNLYLACNKNLKGFDSVEYHIRPNVLNIGEYIETYYLSSNIILDYELDYDVIKPINVSGENLFGVDIFKTIIKNVNIKVGINKNHTIDYALIKPINIDKTAIFESIVSDLKIKKVSLGSDIKGSYSLSYSKINPININQVGLLASNVGGFRVKRVLLDSYIKSNYSLDYTKISPIDINQTGVFISDIGGVKVKRVILSSGFKGESTVNYEQIEPINIEKVGVFTSDIGGVKVKRVILSSGFKGENTINYDQITPIDVNAVGILEGSVGNVKIKKVSLGSKIQGQYNINSTKIDPINVNKIGEIKVLDYDYSVIKSLGVSLMIESEYNVDYSKISPINVSKVQTFNVPTFSKQVIYGPPTFDKPRIITVEHTTCQEITVRVYNDNDVKVKVYGDNVYLGELNANTNTTYTFNHNYNVPGGIGTGGIWEKTFKFEITHRGQTYTTQETHSQPIFAFC